MILSPDGRNTAIEERKKEWMLTFFEFANSFIDSFFDFNDIEISDRVLSQEIKL